MCTDISVHMPLALHLHWNKTVAAVIEASTFESAAGQLGYCSRWPKWGTNTVADHISGSRTVPHRVMCNKEDGHFRQLRDLHSVIRTMFKECTPNHQPLSPPVPIAYNICPQKWKTKQTSHLRGSTLITSQFERVVSTSHVPVSLCCTAIATILSYVSVVLHSAEYCTHLILCWQLLYLALCCPKKSAWNGTNSAFTACTAETQQT